MLDFGWPEMFLIIAVAVLVIGPDEIPNIMVGLGRLFRRFQYAKYAISRQFEEIMEDADLNDIRNSVNFEAEGQDYFDEAAADEDLSQILPPEELEQSELKQDDLEQDESERKND